MSQITIESANAFYERRGFEKANMEVTISNHGTSRMYLHGNQIAELTKSGKLSITNCGWSSNTTKERLNALRSVSIYQKDYVWYLNDKEWDGSPTVIIDSYRWKYVSLINLLAS